MSVCAIPVPQRKPKLGHSDLHLSFSNTVELRLSELIKTRGGSDK